MKNHFVQISRTFSVLAVVAAMSMAQAQEFPNKPITIVVPFAASGPTDIIARTIADKIRVPLKQSVLVENRPGAGSLLALNYVRFKPADGYTMVMVSSGTFTTLPWLNANANYRVSRDFTAIDGIGRNTNILVVNKEAGIDSFAALIAQAKANPGKLNWGLSSALGYDQLAAERIMRAVGVKIDTIGYQGEAPRNTDLLANRVQIAITSPGAFASQISAGKLIPLAVTSASRWPDLPNVPTLEEVGLKDLRIESWYAAFGPAGMPANVVNTLNREISAALVTPDVTDRMRAVGSVPMPLSPAQMTELASSYEQSWGQVIKSMGIKPQ